MTGRKRIRAGCAWVNRSIKGLLEMKLTPTENFVLSNMLMARVAINFYYGKSLTSKRRKEAASDLSSELILAVRDFFEKRGKLV